MTHFYWWLNMGILRRFKELTLQARLHACATRGSGAGCHRVWQLPNNWAIALTTRDMHFPPMTMIRKKQR